MSVRQTPVSYLNTQVAEIPGISTSISTLNGNFAYFSTVTFTQVSTAAGQAYSTAAYVLSSFTNFANDFSTFSTTISSSIGKIPEISTSLSTITGLFGTTSTTVSTLIAQNLATSTSISTLTSTANAALTGAIGGAALSTAFYLPLTGFSTVYGQNFSTINSTLTAISTIDGQQQSTLNIVSTINGQQQSTINVISTIDGQQQSTLNVISTIDGQQTSTINTISTLAGQATSTVNVVSTIAGQVASTVNVLSTLDATQTSNIANLAASTTILQYGARGLQAFNGPYSNADWYDGTNANKTSTIMNFQAGLNASGSGVIGTSNSVSLINNNTASTTMLPLLIGVSGQSIPAYPASANQVLRFAHAGAPGSNSSIIINLVTGGGPSNAIEMNAGEVITMVYAGGGNTNPANYYYFPTL